MPNFRPNPLERAILNAPFANAVPGSGRGAGRPLNPADILSAPGVAAAIANGERVSGYRNGPFLAFGFLAGTVDTILFPQDPERYYFFIVNNSPANRIFVGFDNTPNAGNGLILEVNLGFYEPFPIVPTNAIHVTAAANNTPGFCIAASVPR